MNRSITSMDHTKDCCVTTSHCHKMAGGGYGNNHTCGKPKGHKGNHECAWCDYEWE